MQLLLFIAFSLYVAFYCFAFGRICFQQENKLGGIAVMMLIPLALASPVTYFLIR
ncbi:hypothetical protein NC661_20465 [Aquibacillus koreensis]|uniref:Uncharacterized protein n=1 Tax=Aquibacillus koreensis TaxID=279446 RepID=A0A9X3WPG7_9BACI|nr:hypothetical protein [Aquibacillus koreensis]MCT2536967.1 hypothetical protein [Aquibacillus koreensis]MDC3422730.1 hypothetical protein [Aquibacillus koreensis]